MRGDAVFRQGRRIAADRGGQPRPLARLLTPDCSLLPSSVAATARALVQPVIRYIVRAHQPHVINSIGDLYARRLAWVPSTDPMRAPAVATEAAGCPSAWSTSA